MIRHTQTVSALALALLLLPALSEAQQTGPANVAIVRSLSAEGGLLHRRAMAPDEGARAAQLMDPLSGNDFVQTGMNARAAIQFTDDRSVIRMNPETQMFIRIEGERGAFTKVIDIESGEFWAEVNRRDGSEFRIQTPTAVAAVRGTRFIVRVDPDGRTTIITLDGLLDFFTDVGIVQIPAGSRGIAQALNQNPVVDTTPAAELENYAELILGQGFGSDGSGVTDWETLEIPMIGPDGQLRVITIQVPAGTERGRED